ncbi:hypothetical protein Tco_1483937 [Tanacetum coccineum]
MSIQDMEDLKQHYLDEMLSLSNQIQIKDYQNEKIDISFRRECGSMIDELNGKFNGISIEINKKKELQLLEQVANTYTSILLQSHLFFYRLWKPRGLSYHGNEKLSTIPEEESVEFIMSSIEDIVPSRKKKIDHLVHTVSIQSLLNRANSIIFLIEEFAGELTPINPIPPGIIEADSEKDILLIENLLNDDSSPHYPKELNSEIPNAIIESFSPSPISRGCDLLWRRSIIFIVQVTRDTTRLLRMTTMDSEGDILFSRMYEDRIVPFTSLEIAPDFEDSHARGFIHRPLNLQSFACLYMGIRYPRSY